MSRLKTLVRNQKGVPPLRGGHSLCQGCGVPMVVRTVLSTIKQPAVVVNATGCLEVATTRYPTTAWNVPWLHVAFENAAAVASGVAGLFMETHPNPEKALSDGPNAWPLKHMRALLETLQALDSLVKQRGFAEQLITGQGKS